MLKVNNKNIRAVSLSSFWYFLLLTLNIFHTFYGVEIVLASLLLTLNIFHTFSWCFYPDFEHAFVCRNFETRIE